MYYVCIHTHRHGYDVHHFKNTSGKEITEERIVDTFDIDFEPERGEMIEWFNYEAGEIKELKD